MKKISAAAFVLLLVFSATVVFAQPYGGRGHGRGKGMGKGRSAGASKCDGAGLDMAKKVSVEGTVVSFTGGPGKGEPALTVSTPSGKKVFTPSPYYVVSAAGYEFKEGAKLAIVAAPCSKEGKDELGIVSIKDVATGKELVFRNAEGLPTGGRGARR